MVIKYTNSERDLLARLMRAEAVGDGVPVLYFMVLQLLRKGN